MILWRGLGKRHVDSDDDISVSAVSVLLVVVAVFFVILQTTLMLPACLIWSPRVYTSLDFFWKKKSSIESVLLADVLPVSLGQDGTQVLSTFSS